MTIATGERLPSVSLQIMGENGPETISTDDYFRGRRVVLFAIPGAFTPTCQARHIPSYLENLDRLREKGVDAVACTAVNDVFVMAAQAAQAGASGRIDFLADGNGEFARALGLLIDLTPAGLGHRSARYAMIVEDGVVRTLFVEENPGEMTTSSADNILKALGDG
jgi:peroxiredoxin